MDNLNDKFGQQFSRDVFFPAIEECSCNDKSCLVCYIAQKRSSSRRSAALYESFSSPDSLFFPPRVFQSLNDSCEIHLTSFKAYCTNCSTPICEQCKYIDHNKHTTISLRTALDMSEDEAENIQCRLAQTMQSVDQNIHDWNSDLIRYDRCVKEAYENVNRSWHIIKNALESWRQRNLKKIDEAKFSRYQVVKEKELYLKFCHDKIIRTHNNHLEAIATTSSTKNPVHLEKANEEANLSNNEVQTILQKYRNDLNHWIGFSCSERPILEAINASGIVTVKSPGSVGDGRQLTRQTIEQFNELHLPKLHNVDNFRVLGQNGLAPIHELSVMASPPGRPIATMRGRVICSQSCPTIDPLSSATAIGNNQATADENICRPWGVACDKNGNIYVADRSNNRIIVFKDDGTIIRKIGCHGTGPLQFNRPAGITVDEKRRIIVADKDNHRVQIMSLTGTFVLSFGKKGSEIGQFNYPWDVAANTACEIVVSDTRNHRIQLFSSNGMILRQFGFDIVAGMFKVVDSPRGVAFDPQGDIFVTDFNLHRIIKISYNCRSHEFFECVNELQKSIKLQRPQGIIVDDMGNVIVCDSRGYRVLVFNRHGCLLNEIGTLGTDVGQLDRPSDVALLPNGKIVVVDFGNNRVQIY